MGLKYSKFDIKSAEQQEVTEKDRCQNVTEKPLNSLRKRLLKGSYDLNDPRSPNTHLNRTPLIFDDAMDGTLSLDDTFADLFKATNTQPNVDILTDAIDTTNEISVEETCLKDITKPTNLEVESFYHDEETRMSSAILTQSANSTNKITDPRSPTIGVVRTPIILNESEIFNDKILDKGLSELSISNDIKNDTSIVDQGMQDDQPKKFFKNKLQNKHLNNVKSNTKRSRRKRIYVDTENQYNSTPKAATTYKELNKRTPFSCVRNRAHLRSRSMENSTKSIKTRLSLSSFDDNLNSDTNVGIQRCPKAFE